MFQILKVLVWRIFNCFSRKDADMLVFVPHGGCYLDGYGPLHYKSDNALAFFHYVIEQHGNKYKYRIAADCRNYKKETLLVKEHYSNIDVECFPYFHLELQPKVQKKIARVNKRNIFTKAKYFFVSEELDLPYKSKHQIITILGYYIPFKNDYNLTFLQHSNSIAKCTNHYITTSLLASNLIAHTYGIPLYRFMNLGFSRNDELLMCNERDRYRNIIGDLVDYQVDRIILYTPTHRDYERQSKNAIRSILGIEVEKSKIEDYLRENNMVIVCKLHSAQMRNIISSDVPYGIILYDKEWNLGLCELMQASDALITDYTSAYFDYLLLDRPVLFNFYDFDKYKEYRGFSYDPLDPILAGDVYNNEKSFFEGLDRIVRQEDNWSENRHFVRNLVHKYQDIGSSSRIFDLVLKR